MFKPRKGVYLMMNLTVRSCKTLTILLLTILVAAGMLMADTAGAASDTTVGKPGNFKAFKYGLNYKAKLTWTGAENATGYQIYRATKKNGKYSRIATLKKGARVYIDKKLKKKTNLFYKIRAVGKINGKTKYSGYAPVKKVCVKYVISGSSKITAKKLVSYFKKFGKKYPKHYKKTDAPTITKFCEMYVEEAKAEGIKPEVAFAQAMLETGWLRYGGDVKIGQHNFAGLGATGGGKKGNSFKKVRTGIRAQVQHLKAYANKKKLNKKKVDKRFSYVKRGVSPYVEWLGIPDNPKRQGWAASQGYGYNLVKMISKI